MTGAEQRKAEDGPGLVAGRLLVATPLLLDANFYRTVLYIAEHNLDGALGVVLNRPTKEPVMEHLPEWVPHLSDPAVVFVGGPVANEIAVGMIREPSLEPSGWQTSLPGIGLIDLAAGPEAVGSVSGARVFSGYAGWVAGQLEAELVTSSWVILDAVPEDLFTVDPDGLWRSVLRRQPGRLSMYAMFPDDLRSN